MAESNTQKALRALLSPAPALEAAMMAVLTQRSVDTAKGAQLTVLGKIVGRTGRVPDDEIERRYVRAQISVNKSDGLIEDILTVATLVVSDPDADLVLDNTGAAAYVLRVEGVALDDDIAAVLVQLVLKATSAGVRAIVEWSSSDPGDVLRWDTQGVWDTAVWSNAADTEI